MPSTVKNSLEKHSETIYAFFRIAFSLLFLQHGLQKIFGMFGGINGAGLTPPLFSLFWLAGIIELAVGVGVALGIFTRTLAMIAVIEMAYGYLRVHLPLNFFPIINQGELTLLYLFAFLLIASKGTVKWGLTRK